MKYTPFTQGHRSQVRFEPETKINFDVFVERLGEERVFFDTGKEDAVWYVSDELHTDVLLEYHPFENAVIASVPFAVCGAMRLKELLEKPMALAFQASYRFTFEYSVRTHPLLDFHDVMRILDVELDDSGSMDMVFGVFDMNGMRLKWFSDNVVQKSTEKNTFSRNTVVALCERVNQSLRTHIGRPNKALQSPGLPYDWSLPLLYRYDEDLLVQIVEAYRDIGVNVSSHPEIIEMVLDTHEFDMDESAEFYMAHAHVDLLHVLLYMLRSVVTEANRKEFYEAHKHSDESLFGFVIPFVVSDARRVEKTIESDDVTFDMFSSACDVIMHQFEEKKARLGYVEDLLFNYSQSEVIETIETGDIWTVTAPDSDDVVFAVQILHRDTIENIDSVSFKPWVGRVVWRHGVHGRIPSTFSTGDEIVIEPHLLRELLFENTSVDASTTEIAHEYYYDE